MKTITKMEYRALDSLKKHPKNPRTIKDDSFKKLVKSIDENPDYFEARPIILSDRTGELIILAGNQRYAAAKEIGIKNVPTVLMPAMTEEKEKEIMIRDNISNGDWDYDMLSADWDSSDLQDWGLDVPDWGEETEQGLTDPDDVIPLSDKYIAPPFSVLDTKQSYWLERKRQWRSIIGDSGESRDHVKTIKNDHWEGKPYGASASGFSEHNVSVLDPVLAEVAIKWFAPENAKTFDCFAGDSVFGFVSDYLGNSFTGIEIRKEQADLNNSRLTSANSVYHCDDGQNVLNYIGKETQDFLFSCPPYFDLEVYSDLENDASNQGDYDGFIEILDNAFTRSVSCLKDNRFAVIVVGDIRDKKGFYRTFVDDIKRIFIKAGMPLYNELILLQPLGTAALRANTYMKNRKVVKVHENVLVFYKGDIKNIQSNFNKIEYDEADLESSDI